MPENLKTKACLVIDNGLFVCVAEMLAREFGATYYYSPWECSFPYSNEMLIAKGLPGITRVDNFWDKLDEIDLVVFPDIYMGGLQYHLAKPTERGGHGMRVWGSRHAEELEMYRKESKRVMKEAGLDIGPWKEVVGIPALREYLKYNENVYVKISTTRADSETFKSENYRMIEPRLDKLEHRLGKKKDFMRFIVEEEIKAAVVNLGYDGYTVDGKFPDQAMTGVEIKDKAYLGRSMPYDKLPKQIQETNAKIAMLLERFQCRNFFTLEMAVDKKDTPYIIDPCARWASPPGELCTMMYSDMPQVMWAGGNGELMNPTMAAKWGAEVLIHSDWATSNWQPIWFPPKIADQVKLRNHALIDKKLYVIPQLAAEPAPIGAVVGVGDTPEEAIDSVKEACKQIKGYGVETPVEAFDDAMKEIEKLKGSGIEL
jgi:hypothetical protein